MSDKTQDVFRNAAVVIMAIVILVSVFLLGTVVGFNTAMDSLSSCKETPCSSIGVNASSCEICPESEGYRILMVK